MDVFMVLTRAILSLVFAVIAYYIGHTLFFPVTYNLAIASAVFGLVYVAVYYLDSQNKKTLQ